MLQKVQGQVCWSVFPHALIESEKVWSQTYQLVSYWTHLPLVLHICISVIGQHWFRYWLVAYSVPNHYLNQCWAIVNWTLRNTSSEILIKMQSFSLTKLHLKIPSAKWQPICPGRWVYILNAERFHTISATNLKDVILSAKEIQNRLEPNNLVSTVSANGQALIGARTSAAKVSTKFRSI